MQGNQSKFNRLSIGDMKHTFINTTIWDRLRCMRNRRKQAIIQQSFGYTGYQTDKENELYFAQVRLPYTETGRVYHQRLYSGISH